MLVLLLAAQVAVATPAIPAPEITAPDVAVYRTFGEKTRETPNVFAVPVYCQKLTQKTDRPIPRTAPPTPVPSIGGRLDRMPPAYGEYAVDRRVAGCPVPTYAVDGQRPR